VPGDTSIYSGLRHGSYLEATKVNLTATAFPADSGTSLEEVNRSIQTLESVIMSVLENTLSSFAGKDPLK